MFDYIIIILYYIYIYMYEHCFYCLFLNDKPEVCEFPRVPLEGCGLGMPDGALSWTDFV